MNGTDLLITKDMEGSELHLFQIAVTESIEAQLYNKVRQSR
jgi:hypothetical protein